MDKQEKFVTFSGGNPTLTVKPFNGPILCPVSFCFTQEIIPESLTFAFGFLKTAVPL